MKPKEVTEKEDSRKTGDRLHPIFPEGSILELCSITTYNRQHHANHKVVLYAFMPYGTAD